ncbi:MAG: SpoIVB peptidase S55 domain-containing protein [bacterium]|nr:SpoIVB peptidase S55 domain-containing protein [bacterium]
MNFKKKLQIIFLLLVTLFPSIVLAYSTHIIPGGSNVGINIQSKYVTIVGFYKVSDTYIGEEAGFKIGDQIEKIENEGVESINSMIDLVDKYKDQSEIEVSFFRNGKSMKTNLSLKLDENGVYKTGIYVKDQINGIGTLTYIDPETNIYGALGHEIADKSTLQKVEIKDGKIFKSEITGIKPSRNGEPGEKQAKLYVDDVYGTIKANRESGIFGIYMGSFSTKDAIEVAEPDDVRIGKAVIRTVIEGSDIQEYEIEILEVNKSSPTKNILFQITSPELLEKTGGVVAGMSGSPIIQNNKIIGAVTHVIVNDSEKGYGIFIQTMLEEGEK